MTMLYDGASYLASITNEVHFNYYCVLSWRPFFLLFAHFSRKRQLYEQRVISQIFIKIGKQEYRNTEASINQRTGNRNTERATRYGKNVEQKNK